MNELMTSAKATVLRWQAAATPAIQSAKDWLLSRPVLWYAGVHAMLCGLTALLCLPMWRAALEANFADDQAVRSTDRVRYFDWINSYYFPDHKYVIFAFILTIVAMVASLAVFAILLRTPAETLEARRHRLQTSVAAAALMFGGLLGLSALKVFLSPIDMAIIFVALTMITAMPLTRAGLKVSPQTLSPWLPVAATAMVAEAAVLCMYFATAAFPIGSDHLQIPSETLIRTSRADPGRYVDTIGYINDELLWGNHKIPDLRTWRSEDPPCLKGNHFVLPKTLALENFVKEHKYRFYFHTPTNHLCFVGRLLKEETFQLTEMFQSQREHILTVAAENGSILRDFQNTPMTDEVVSFSQRNKIHFISFIHDLEQVFHHHFQFLNPIKELALGRPLQDINAPYGLSFVPIKAAMQTLAGGVTYQSFLSVMFSIQILYIVGFVVLVHVLYRSWPSTFIMAAIVVGCFTGLGLTTLFTGTGYGPARHGLDLASFAFFYAYLRSAHPGYLAAAAAVGLCNPLLDRFVGAFFPLALAGTLVLMALIGKSQRPRFELSIGALILAVAGALFWGLGNVLAPNPYASQFFDGVWAFPVGNAQVGLYLVVVFCALAVAMWSITQRYAATKFAALLWIAYSVAFLFYWLMVPNYGHLYKVYPIAGFAVVILWHECIADFSTPAARRRIGTVAVAFSALFWFSMSRNLATTSLDTYGYFRNHKLYDWSFDSLKVKSTMNPQPFMEAVALLRNATASQNPVFILSEFDSLLLFLAGRNNAMPHFELPTFLNSPKHLNLVIDALKNQKPQTLIVDSCIACSAVPYHLTRSIPGVHPAYFNRSIHKVDRLQQLRKIYHAIAEDYIVAEGQSTAMLTVLKRRP